MSDWDFIINLVDEAIEVVSSKYVSNPFKFYTENDLVCEFYQAFSQKMGTYDIADINGKAHNLVHTEYPTPFRCDMSGYNFEVKKDDELSPRGGKYSRGHYDVVILNPSLIRQLSREELRAQKYEVYKKNVLPKIRPGNPMVLYGLEFVLHRKQVNNSNSANLLSKIIMQDHKKLIESTNPLLHTRPYNGFMLKYKTLAFFENNDYIKDIEKRLEDRGNIRLCYPVT
jgi:hypothetical protein